MKNEIKCLKSLLLRYTRDFICIFFLEIFHATQNTGRFFFLIFLLYTHFNHIWTKCKDAVLSYALPISLAQFLCLILSFKKEKKNVKNCI